MAKAVPKKAPVTKAAKPAADTAKAPTTRSSAKAAPAKQAAKKAVKAAPATKKAEPAPADTKHVAKAAKKTGVEAEAAVEKPARAVSPYDVKFLEAQRKLLLEERAKLVGEAENLEAEAASLMEDLEPGDVQFDDESGEGDTLVVERERDLALSAQARQMVNDIDAALLRIEGNTYGLSLVSGRPIPKERLRAIPWATELVEEKVGGLGTRR
jgi:RNA polymerase-binding transcription factor DksA